MVATMLTAAQIAALRLPTTEEVRTVADALPQLESGTWRTWDPRPGIFLEVGPGLLRVFRTSSHLPDAARDRALESAHRETQRRIRRERAVYRSPMALLSDSDLASLDPRKPARVNTSTGRITGWSRRSKLRMNTEIRRLDFAPLFADGIAPVMLTLTMPGRDDDGRDTWTDFAPTPAAFKAIVNRFTTAFRDSWSSPIRGVWKMEFQHRGAPHLHILMTPPAGVAHGQYPFEFRRWVSEAWARAVGSEGTVRANHIKAGTGIDQVADQFRDPQRIAVYFGKHGNFDKSYQNDMPGVWRDAIAHGETGARFWGVWGLKKASAVLQLNDVGSTTIETMIDPLGVSRIAANIIAHYRQTEDGTWVLAEERHEYATDASVMRAYQRMVDESGTRASDAVKVERYMRKLSRSLAMRGQELVRNKHGQLVLPPESRVIRRVKFQAAHPDTGELRTLRRYRIGYYRGGSGCLLLNDGCATGRDLLRVLDSPSRWTLAS